MARMWLSLMAQPDLRALPPGSRLLECCLPIGLPTLLGRFHALGDLPLHPAKTFYNSLPSYNYSHSKNG